MKWLTTIAITALLCIQSIHAEHVEVLTTAEFDNFVNNKPLSLVEFFAPWCGHCKALAPKYEAAAEKLNSEDSPIKLASVDCTVEKDLCSKYGVGGYPTLKIFRNDGNAPIDYKGGRETDAIVSFMKKQNQPAYHVINTQDDVSKLIKTGDDVVIIGIFDNADKQSIEEFQSTANTLRNDYTFGIVEGDAAKEIADHFNTHTNTVVLIKKSEPDTPAVYDKPVTADELKQFINTESFALIGNIGPENYAKYQERNLPLVWLFLDEASDKVSDFIEHATQVAKDYKGKLSLVRLDGVKWAEHAKHFGIKAGELPGIVIEDRTAQKNYVYPFGDSLTSTTLGGWVKSFIDKTLKPTVKSAPVPENNDKPVTTVVGSTFETIVLDNDKDVLVEFYAPWCGHCKQLAPKYEELGEIFKDNDSVVIAAVDATENDTPAQIKGFPTIIFYPAGDKENPITYNGDRSADAMAQFIRENGKAAGSVDATSEADEHDDTKDDL